MIHDQTANQLPRWAYIVLALCAAAIGLASSVVTAKFFVLGLERVEPDSVARDVLIATGVLMIATELMAFGIAALLPTGQLRLLRTKLIVCGVLLLGFEAATIYITQVALNQSATAGATANNTRTKDLRASIDNRRAAAQSLRSNGAMQSASANSWTRTLGATALRDALKVEQDIAPLAIELARLESTERPSITTALGEQGMLAYSVARALLISAMGLLMFSAAGTLLRQVRGKQSAVTGEHTTNAAYLTQGFRMTASPMAFRGMQYSGNALAASVPGPTVLSAMRKAVEQAQEPAKATLADHGTVSTGASIQEACSGDGAGRRFGKTVLKVVADPVGKGRCKKVPIIPASFKRTALLQNG